MEEVGAADDEPDQPSRLRAEITRAREAKRAARRGIEPRDLVGAAAAAPPPRRRRREDLHRPRPPPGAGSETAPAAQTASAQTASTQTAARETARALALARIDVETFVFKRDVCARATRSQVVLGFVLGRLRRVRRRTRGCAECFSSLVQVLGILLPCSSLSTCTTSSSRTRHPPGSSL